MHRGYQVLVCAYLLVLVGACLVQLNPAVLTACQNAGKQFNVMRWTAGDFNLVLLDQMIKEPKLRMVNTCNELNAGYAADGYARERGVACCVVTYTGAPECKLGTPVWIFDITLHAREHWTRDC